MSSIPLIQNPPRQRARSRSRAKGKSVAITGVWSYIALGLFVFVVTMLVSSLVGQVAFESTRQAVRKAQIRSSSAKDAVSHLQSSVATFGNPQEMEDWAKSRGFVETYIEDRPSSPRGYVAINR